MNGDGKTTGASGIGSVQLQYDCAGDSVRLHADGAAAPACRLLPASVAAAEFPKASKYLARALVEYAISGFKVVPPPGP